MATIEKNPYKDELKRAGITHQDSESAKLYIRSRRDGLSPKDSKLKVLDAHRLFTDDKLQAEYERLVREEGYGLQKAFTKLSAPIIDVLYQKATDLISISTPKLCDLFDTSNQEKVTPEVATVRGWILDELEQRNPTAFGKWMDANTDSPTEFYKDVV